MGQDKKKKKETKIGPRFKKGNCFSKPQGCLDASCYSETGFNTKASQDSDSPAPQTGLSTGNNISGASVALGAGTQLSSPSIHARAEPLTQVGQTAQAHFYIMLRSL